MWGTHTPIQYQAVKLRFIPTHVGNTNISFLWCRLSTAHPHACGEHLSTLAIASFVCGSSPRMWGTHPSCFLLLPAKRFIPTHVGNTRLFCTAATRLAVHPHACGEHDLALPIDSRKSGSSPRMWGTPTESVLPPDASRFIPTHVGNTPTLPIAAWIHSVHPHACGEHGGTMKNTKRCIGSSPRMWGTQCGRQGCNYV